MLEENGFKIVLYENFQQNPFWESFYGNPDRYIFETEITFTLQHYHSIKQISNTENTPVCDYSLLQDIAYANIGLDGNKLEIYHLIVQELLLEINKPSHLIHLKCSSKEELKRIRNRARSVEQNININFLNSLKDALLTILKQEKKIKILEIDSEKYNFLNNQEHKNIVLEEILNFLNQSPCNIPQPKG